MLASLILASLPACIPSQASGYAYLPTPSPCVVLLTDPRTGQREALVIRWPWAAAPVTSPVPGFDPRDFIAPKERK